MSEEDKDNINKEGDVKVDENQPGGENKPTEPENVESSGVSDQYKDSSQSEGESSPNINEKPESSAETDQEVEKSNEDKKEHEVIHKKDGRLHIYVRQDKYKGELKSKNWVGRRYIDGKQKISSSGTPNLEEAIPILEKWFDDIHANKGKEEAAPQETPTSAIEQPSATTEQTPPVVTTVPPTPEAPQIEKTPEPIAVKTVTAPIEETKTVEPKNVMGGMLNKLKAFKFKKPSFGGGDKAPKISAKGKINFKGKLEGFFNQG